jgi:hypothetical protein
MKLYHGSYTKIREIDLSKCARYRDFGQGFYVTKFRCHAEEWAKKIGGKHGNDGFVTEFEFYETFFDAERHYKVLRFDGYSEQWLDFVIMNRDESYKEQRHDYDFIEGPVANDKIQHRLRQFLRGRIPRDIFLKELSHHEQTHQICFCTIKSLQTLKLVEDETLWNIEEIGEPLLEQFILDFNIGDETAADKFYSSKTFARLADESTEFYKKSWQEIYEMLKQELNK